MVIEPIQTGFTLVSSAVPDRSTRKWKGAYTRLFQSKRSRIKVPVKCFYVCVGKHRILIDAGWSEQVVSKPGKHLGIGLFFASEPIMTLAESARNQLKDKPIDAIYMTHLDCDHISGLHDFTDIPVYSSEEEIVEANRNRLRYGKLLQGLHIAPIPFKENPEAPFGYSCDLFHDGSIIAYLTPTHSKGSTIYKICDGEGYALIVGDNGYNTQSWEQGILPGPLYHAENMKKCLAWIKGKSEDPACVGIYCAHQ